MPKLPLASLLRRNSNEFRRVVPFDPERDRLFLFDFTSANKTIEPDLINNTTRFGDYIKQELASTSSRYGFGGYAENRILYSRSNHFDDGDEPRRLHLGIDIWGPSGTTVVCPYDGLVHSFAFNGNDSDYGATIILSHVLDGQSFHTLYGHLSLSSIRNLAVGDRIRQNDHFAEFGMVHENGNWPPHLHFQVIEHTEGWEGDYPGVCRFSEREQWLANCPDPDLILQMGVFAVAVQQ